MYEMSRSARINYKIVRSIRNSCTWLLWELSKTKNWLTGRSCAPLTPIRDRILICGNGPSVKKIDMRYYADQGVELMCVNFFASNHPDFFQLKPKYYCCVDPDLYDPNSQEFVEEKRRLVEALEKVDWDMTYICICGQRPAFRNSHIHVQHINLNRYETRFPNLSRRMWEQFRKNKATFGYNNVILACLYYALTAGAKEICLTGVESDVFKDYFVTEQNKLVIHDVHFYGEEDVEQVIADPDGRSQVTIWFDAFSTIFLGYNVLAEYAKYLGAQVTNLTVHSFIDVFPKAQPKNIEPSSEEKL